MSQPFELIDLTTWPTLPSPWSSSDPGETWIIGDFFAFLQKDPEPLGEVLERKARGRATPTGMRYHYALTVFYRLACNPHGPSIRPVMTVALEQVDMGGGKQAPVFIGVFLRKEHVNLGQYDGPLDAASARAVLLANAFSFGITGEPRLLGDIAAAKGHPDTGLPAAEPPRAKSGCAGMLVALAMLPPAVSAISWWC